VPSQVGTSRSPPAGHAAHAAPQLLTLVLATQLPAQSWLPAGQV